MNEATERFKPGDIIAHFKRETINEAKEEGINTEYLYRYVGVCTHSETRETLVVYQALYSNDDVYFGQLFVRPYEMFYSEVDKKKYPKIKKKIRFYRAIPTDINLLNCYASELAAELEAKESMLSCLRNALAIE